VLLSVFLTVPVTLENMKSISDFTVSVNEYELSDKINVWDLKMRLLLTFGLVS
jgi:hypothetical protein